jgi:hypothetical protein
MDSNRDHKPDADLQRPNLESRDSAADTTQCSDLTGEALRLLVTLEGQVSLTALWNQFPRVLNKIAEVWRRPVEADRLFEDLLFDRRGGRQGFPLTVISELTQLREYHHTLYPTKIDLWDQMHRR